MYYRNRRVCRLQPLSAELILYELRAMYSSVVVKLLGSVDMMWTPTARKWGGQDSRTSTRSPPLSGWVYIIVVCINKSAIMFVMPWSSSLKLVQPNGVGEVLSINNLIVFPRYVIFSSSYTYMQVKETVFFEFWTEHWLRSEEIPVCDYFYFSLIQSTLL